MDSTYNDMRIQRLIILAVILVSGGILAVEYSGHAQYVIAELSHPHYGKVFVAQLLARWPELVLYAGALFFTAWILLRLIRRGSDKK